jgi:hypothetical protein
MRRCLGGLVLGIVLVARAHPAAAAGPAGEAGLALGSAAINVLYLPAKATLAVLGLAAGSVTGLLTGGDVRSAYALWVPTASGTYLVTPSHLDGRVPLEFFGSDYADRPSEIGGGEGTTIYDAMYSSR